MTVVSMATRYHAFGWAMKRIMGADNVRASSQREFAQLMSQDGYVIGQQLVSDYMRPRADDDGQERPRAIPPMEFVAAVISTFRLDASQREDLVSSWLEILPEKRRVAVLGLCETLRGAELPAGAWRDVLAFERDRELSEGEKAEGGRTAGDTAS